MKSPIINYDASYIYSINILEELLESRKASILNEKNQGNIYLFFFLVFYFLLLFSFIFIS